MHTLTNKEKIMKKYQRLEIIIDMFEENDVLVVSGGSNPGELPGVEIE